MFKFIKKESFLVLLVENETHHVTFNSGWLNLNVVFRREKKYALAIKNKIKKKCVLTQTHFKVDFNFSLFDLNFSYANCI